MGLAFALKYKDTLLDLVEDTVLTVEWYSTVFNESEIFRGSYSYPVELKLSAKNKTLLGMPHLLENRISRQKIEVSIILFGHTWKKADFDYEVHADRITGNLLIDNAIIADWLRDMTLPNMFSYYDGEKTAYHGIDIGADVPARTAYLNATSTAEPGEYPMAFPGVYNYGWDGSFRLWQTSGLINLYFNTPTQTFTILNGNQFFCPMFYLTWLVREVCDNMGFKALGSFFENDEIKRWIIYNSSYYTGRQMHQNGFEILPSLHFPKITIGSLFKILRNDLKLCIYFDSLTREAYFELPNTILEGVNVIDLGDTVRDSLKIKNSLPKKFNIKLAKDENDSTYQYYDAVDSMYIGDAESVNTVELSLGATYMGKQSDLNEVVFYRWPMVEQIANIYDVEFGETEMYNKEGEISKNEFTFRLLSYRGLESYTNTDPSLLTSYATSDNRNGLGEIDDSILATDPANENSWLRKICEPFYQMLHLSEQVDFDIYTSIDLFSKLSPLIKGMISSKSGVKQRLFFDRITFEPKKRNTSIFAKIKAYSMHNSYALMGKNVVFQVGSVTKKEPMIYFTALFDEYRSEDFFRFHKVRFNFYWDKYCQHPLAVNSLRISFEIHRHITTASGSGLMVFEREITTGVGVTTHLTSEEFTTNSYQSGGLFYSEIVVLENEHNKYVPVLL